MTFERRLPVGAEPDERATQFRVWAPGRSSIAIVSAEQDHPLTREASGYHSGSVPITAGADYRVRVDNQAETFPDPASRHQPQGPFGHSRVVDGRTFAWTDDAWHGIDGRRHVLYELHVGTFTTEGTWRSATAKLGHLANLGVSIIEMMPVNDFAGRFGWGYDGVGLFAPTHLYGAPDDLRAFVNSAHALGIAVILDVVYNHLGPDGNYFGQFSKEYFTDRYQTDWGEALNFDGDYSQGMRDLVVANAAYWTSEFHFDGLRLDATQCVYDVSEAHVLAELADAAREAAGHRKVLIIAENEPQASEILRPRDRGGLGLDAVWNDDYHHAARVAVTGRSEAYYADFRGTPQELIAAAKYGYLFQGQMSGCKSEAKGTAALDIQPTMFVNFVQNHDQVANSATGARLHQITSHGRARAITALTLLMPGIPMLFQGQEFWATAPFLYFADHRPELAELVRSGRRQSLAIFASLASPEAQASLADPEREATYEACKLDWSEADANAAVVAFHRDLIALRRSMPEGLNQKGAVDGSVLASEALVLRFFSEAGDDRLLFVNLGPDLHLRSIADPLIAPPSDRIWSQEWSSEDPRYGGIGAPVILDEGGWHLAAHSAALLSTRSSTVEDVREGR